MASNQPAAVGPWRQFWRRHSARYELVFSSAAAWALHVVVLLLVFFAHQSLQSRRGTPPGVDVVQAEGEGPGAPGPQGDGLAPGATTGEIGLFAQPATSSSAIQESTSFLPDPASASIVNLLPKTPDVPPGAIGISNSLFSSDGLTGVSDGRGGGQGGTGGGGGGLNGNGGGMVSTKFFGTHVWGSKFVYVIDRSGSMSERDRLGQAKRELLASLASLQPDSQFQIIFYNLRADLMPIGKNARRLVPATDANKTLAARYLDTIIPDGGTDHLPALKAALALSPDVIFFLTDADDLRPNDVKEVTALNKGRANIHTIEFDTGPQVERQTPLRELAERNGGTYRYIDVNKVGQPPEPAVSPVSPP